jgi:hypothetical protein
MPDSKYADLALMQDIYLAITKSGLTEKECVPVLEHILRCQSAAND